MASLNPYGAITPDSRRFAEYLDHLRARWIENGVRPQRINGALALLREIERQRLCYSKNVEAAFKSRKIANEALAKRLGYKTNRQVQKLRQWLETQGVLEACRTKANGFFNKWNSYRFSGFREWFIHRYQQPVCKTGHPKEDNDPRSLSGPKPKSKISFPNANLTSADPLTKFWRRLAYEVTDTPPCLATLSQKFRLNLRRHQITCDDPSVIARWKAFVGRAVEFQQA